MPLKKTPPKPRFLVVGDNESTSGWIFTLSEIVILWASKNQMCLSHSTM